MTTTRSRKIPKTLSGIETFCEQSLPLNPSRKIPKTLSGIETELSKGLRLHRIAGKYLKPYQGLKQVILKLPSLASSCRKIPKTLSGIETDTKL